MKQLVVLLIVVIIGMGMSNALGITTTKQLPQCSTVTKVIEPISELF